MLWMMQRWLNPDSARTALSPISRVGALFFLIARGEAHSWPDSRLQIDAENCMMGKRINKPVTKVGKNPEFSSPVKKLLPFHTLLTLPKRIICVFINSFVLLTSSWSEINSVARLAP